MLTRLGLISEIIQLKFHHNTISDILKNILYSDSALKQTEFTKGCTYNKKASSKDEAFCILC